MTKPLIAATFVAVLALGWSAPLSAQNRPAAPGVAPQPRNGVAVIDLTYIFKNHARFKAMTEAMRAKVEAAEARLRGERESVQKLIEQLQQYKPGAPNYKELEENVAKSQADLEVRVRIQKKEFLTEEAKIYMMVYKEIFDEVKYYAESNGITLVLRFNGDEPDQNNPQDVLKELNKSVVYYHPGIDVTPIILEQLNRRAGTQPAAAAPPAGQNPGAVRPQQSLPPRR